GRAGAAGPRGPGGSEAIAASLVETSLIWVLSGSGCGASLPSWALTDLACIASCELRVTRSARRCSSWPILVTSGGALLVYLRTGLPRESTISRVTAVLGCAR